LLKVRATMKTFFLAFLMTRWFGWRDHQSVQFGESHVSPVTRHVPPDAFFVWSLVVEDRAAIVPSTRQSKVVGSTTVAFFHVEARWNDITLKNPVRCSRLGGRRRSRHTPSPPPLQSPFPCTC
jgi:hypothetical protein